MPFVRIKGLDGLVWEPDPDTGRDKKHPCPDCHDCQWCSDTRCKVCRCQRKQPDHRRKPKHPPDPALNS